MSQQHTSFPLFRTSSQGGGSSNSQHNQISLSQHSSHLQQPTLAAPNRAPNNSPFTNSFSKLHGSFSQGGGGAGLSRPASADRQQFSGSQRPNAFNQHIPSSRLHDTSDTVRPRSFPPKQSIPGMSFSQPTSSQQVSYLDAGYLKNPPKSFTHLGPVNPPRVLKPVLSQELDERNPISVHASTAPAISTATALSNSQVNSQILSGMNVKIDSIMRGIQDVIVPISSVGTKLSDGSDKLDLLIVTCGKMSDSLGELLFIVKQSQQQLTDLVCTSQASKTALISQETQTQPPSPNMKNGMPGMQGPNLKALTLSESAIPIVKASELVDTSQVRIPPANRSKRPEAEVLGQGDMDLQPSMNQRNIRPRISSDPESLVPRMNQMVQQQAAVSDTRPGVASALRARSLAEPAKDCHASPWIVKTGVSSGSHGAVQGRIDRSPPILPAHFHRKPAIRQSPAPSLASRLLDMDEMSGDCSGNEERTPFVGSGTPVLKVLDRGGSSALDSGALQLQRNDKDCGHESTGSRGQRESNCSGKLEGSFDDNDEDLARQVAARMRRHRERRARTKKLA